MRCERKTIYGIDCFICRGQSVRRPFRETVARLQGEYASGAAGCVWGCGAGCWDALWLAEQYDVRLLVLEDFPSAVEQANLRARAQQNLFAVVCPVVVCPQSAQTLPELPNAPVYISAIADQFPRLLRSLYFANDL